MTTGQRIEYRRICAAANAEYEHIRDTAWDYCEQSTMTWEQKWDYCDRVETGAWAHRQRTMAAAWAEANE